ncbi:MAG: malto-oligosyltrehalose synthase [Bacillota bacterium]
MPPILSTCRLQLHAGFRLEHVRALIPYFAALGVSHLHCSPVLTARRGSAHGYDVTDPTRLNPALGTEEEFVRLANELQAAGLGLVLDIVPNHMAASLENPFWEDVLTHGSGSRFARWFDIEWRAAEPVPRPRIVLPVLGDLRVHALERGEFSLEVVDGRFRVRYFEHQWPLDPLTLFPLLEMVAEEAADLGVDPAAVAAIRSHGRMLRALSRRRGRTQAERQEVASRAERAGARLAHLFRDDGAAAAAAIEGARRFASESDGAARLRRLLDAQAYRVVYWRRAARELNYRRFFDVNELVALHMEDPEVFDQTHARLLEWRRAGLVDGFRIDHPDGLLDPLAYLRRLVDEAFEWRRDARYPVFVEKILTPGEQLRAAWPVAGTTGYDFLNEAERLFVDPAGLGEIERDYRRLIRRPLDFGAVADAGKRRALEGGLSPGVRSLAVRLLRLAVPGGPVLTPAAARLALIELIAALRVYRTYIDRHTPGGAAEDRELLAEALATCRARGRAPAAALDHLASVLLEEPGPDAEREQLRLRFVQRLQQLSGPAMAKGVEDTAFYAWVPLASLNEVGGSPEQRDADPVVAFHVAAARRAAAWPCAMLAVTTHDTKRSADVRARLDVLSEIPDVWEERVYRWRKLNRPLQRRTADGSAPDANALYLLFQTLVGVWPAGETVGDACRKDLAARVGEYMLKAVREAKQRTSWLEPDAEYESALAAYIAAALDPAQSGEFLADLAAFAARIAVAGWCNALSRTVVQLTSPGVPDLYQGDELWNLALVDPDNRRPVDFERRRRALDAVTRGFESGDRAAFLRALTATPADGLLKLHVIRRLLLARRERPGLFVGAGYEPAGASGTVRALAFARTAGDDAMLVVVPRLIAQRVAGEGAWPIGSRFWADAEVGVPEPLRGRRVQCVLSGASIDLAGPTVAVGEILVQLPAAVLVPAA